MKRVTTLTVLLAALLGLTALVRADPAGAAPALGWSLPSLTTTQAPFAKSDPLSQIACADAEHCYAAPGGDFANGSFYPTASGQIFVTDDAGQSWSTARGADDVGGGPFACAPDSAGATTPPFCVALDGNRVENLSASGLPVTGPANDVPGLGLATSLSCPSATLCVAATDADAGKDGQIVSSTSPLTGVWNPVDADPGHGLLSISCPDSGLCVAVDNGGGVIVSTDPAGGRWTRTTLGSGLDAVSCASDNACTAVSSAGQVYATTTPASGGWTATAPAGATGSGSVSGSVSGSGSADDLTGVSCPSAAGCVITSAGGTVYATAPVGGQPQATATGLPDGLGQVSCPAVGSCEAVAGSAVLSSTNAAGPGAQWSTHPVDAWTPLAAIACPSASLCVALQQDGRAAASTTPLLSSDTWPISTADPGGTPVALSCPSSGACYGVDRTGHLLWSRSPAAGGWKLARIDTKGAPVAISCPSSGFCTMVDAAGYLFTSTNPAGGARAWHSVRRTVPSRVHNTTVTLTSVSCPTSTFCVVTDGGGWIYTTTHPRGTASAWRATQIWKRRSSGYATLAQVSCPTARNCTVMGTYAGWWKESQYNPDALGTYALSSFTPGGAARTWKVRHIDAGYVESDASTNDPGLSASLSCPTTRLCAMVDDLGTAYTNTGVASGPWLSASIDALAVPDMSDGHPGLTGVACFAGPHCVAVDGFGNRFSFGAGAGPVIPVANAHYGG